MGIDLGDLDVFVLSHEHIDHTGGLAALTQNLASATTEGRQIRVPELIVHPRCFWQKEKDGRKNGSVVSEKEARRQFTLTLSDKPVWITGDLILLGEILRKYAFEQGNPGNWMIHHPEGNAEPDFLLDDSALAYRSPEGLVITTGCSYAGICNITELARDVCGEQKVSDIISGFHLIRPEPERLEKTGAYLGGLSLKAPHACHCTLLPARRSRLRLIVRCRRSATG